MNKTYAKAQLAKLILLLAPAVSHMADSLQLPRECLVTMNSLGTSAIETKPPYPISFWFYTTLILFISLFT